LFEALIEDHGHKSRFNQRDTHDSYQTSATAFIETKAHFISCRQSAHHGGRRSAYSFGSSQANL